MTSKGKSIGLVLSGGGARGIAHLGVLKALNEFGVRPSILSGTSAGAIAAAFYANGFSIEEILSIIKKGHFFSFSNLLFEKPGVFSMKGFEQIYAKYFPENTFESLQIPLHVAATDLLKGQITYFSGGNLSQALMASSCIPVVFQPVQYNSTYYVDGGVLDNFPVEPLLGKCDIIIGSYVNSIKEELSEIHMNDVLDRSFHLALSNSVRNKIKLCNVFLEPPDMSQFGILDLKKIDAIFEYGYNYCKTQEHSLRMLL